MIRLGGLDARTSAASLGGWTLSIHHTLGLETGTLYLGDGEKRDLGDSNQRVAIRVAGNGTATGAAVGPLALGAALVNPSAVAVGADGTVYVGSPGRVRRVTVDGALAAVAGTGTTGFSADGGLATAARLSNSITALEVGDDGSVYIADAANGRIRRVTPDGIIRTVAGSGSTSCAVQALDTGMSEGQGDALAVPMPGVADIEFASDGALWIAIRCSLHASRVRSLQHGKVRHVAGHPYPSWYATQVRPRVFTPHPVPPPPAVLQLYKIYGWDGSIRGDSTSYASFGSEWAVLNNIEGMTPNGTGMYIAEGTGVGDIRIVPSDGGIRTFRTQYTLDGDPFDNCYTTGCAWQVASDGITEVPADITKLPGGIAYIASQGASQRIRWAPNDRQKPVEDIAGGGTEELNGERVITGAHRLRLRQPVAMDLGPDGALYVADRLGHKVIKLANAGPGFYEAVTIPSEDGRELYEFDETGRHLTTRDAATQALVWTFEYDEAGRLSAVRDAYDAATTIERTGAGAATAIVSPDGVRTELALDPGGYLGGLVHPTGDAYLFEYQGDGLLTTMTTPRGHVHAFEYDERGLLVRDEDPEGGFQELERISTTSDAVSVEHRSALGIATVYDASEGELGERTRTQHHPDGTTAVQADLAAGVHRTTSPDGTVVEVQTEPDPWLGPYAPFAARTSVTTPQGRSRADTETRAFTEGPGGVLASATATTTAAGDPTRAWVTTFAAAQGATPAVAVGRSPQQRALRSTLGLHGRLERVEQGTWNGNAFVPGPFHALVLGYDARGRLDTTTVGTRVTTVAYGEDGYVSQVVDAQASPMPSPPMLEAVSRSCRCPAVGRSSSATMPMAISSRSRRPVARPTGWSAMASPPW
jgi:YD repeat-containing protein